ncbi:hypothetical protein [Serratia symbiotica]|uniref:Uncharacterized protein n=1 Tax=Serratia symbiotica TaxID=138074 RepID=A0A068Z377_9GAMM|nr:hypothetical protein [Serratia symbiotica]QLH61869.1 hypothetical protein SYMBAF_01480 [Serratia symbiotica]CDS56607.1 hypothetical protein SYMBAF_160081 [Serratia symbiotica]
MAPLAEAWVSLLHRLCENKYLDKEEVISALLPHKKEHSVASLAHAIAGAAWNSEAATKLCALLSDVAGSDENSRQDIMARLSLKLPGDKFSQLKRDQAADFYERAKKQINSAEMKRQRHTWKKVASFWKAGNCTG